MAEPYVHSDAWSPCGPEDGGGAYPFLSPSSDVRRLLADVVLSFEPAGGWVPPLRLAWVAGLGAATPGTGSLPAMPPGDPPTTPDEPAGWAEPAHVRVHPVDAVIRGGDDAVIFDSTSAAEYAASDHGPYLRVHRWRGAAGTLRLTERTRFPTVADAWKVPNEIRPRNGILDPRAYAAACRRVTAIAVEDGPTTAGAVALRPGYNVALVGDGPATTGVVRRSSLVTSAIAGAGAGRAPCTAIDATATVSSLGGAVADSRGRIQLQGDDCCRVVPDIVDAGDGAAILTPGRIRLDDGCTPCCTCAGYVDLAAALVRAYTRLTALAATAEASRDALVVAKDRWTRLLPPTGSAVVLVRMRAVAYDVNFVDFVLSVCNRSDDCLPSPLYEIVVTPAAGSGMVPTIIQDGCRATVVCGDEAEALVVDPPVPVVRPCVVRGTAGDDAHLRIYCDAIQPRSVSTVRLRFSFANVDAATPRTVVFTRVGSDDSTSVFVPPRPAT